MVNHTLKGQDGLAGGVAILDGGLWVCVGQGEQGKRGSRRADNVEQADTWMSRWAVCIAAAAARVAAVPLLPLLLPPAIARLLPQAVSQSASVALPPPTHLEVQVNNVVAVVCHVWLVPLHAQLGFTASNLLEVCQPADQMHTSQHTQHTSRCEKMGVCSLGSRHTGSMRCRRHCHTCGGCGGSSGSSTSTRLHDGSPLLPTGQLLERSTPCPPPLILTAAGCTCGRTARSRQAWPACCRPGRPPAWCRPRCTQTWQRPSPPSSHAAGRHHGP